MRLIGVELLGQLFALPGRHVAQEYRQFFSEFLKRFDDEVVEVRVAVVNCATYLACSGLQCSYGLVLKRFYPCNACKLLSSHKALVLPAALCVLT